MGQITPYLRRAAGGHSHWRPGCREMHMIPDSWSFDGNLAAPTFNPSVKISGKKMIRDERGSWLGGWERDAAGNPIDEVCHYHLHGGVLKFCGDSTHALAGKEVPLPPLPDWLTDP
jgi:hypothetical protein